MAAGIASAASRFAAGDGVTTTLDADAVILASGGFQGNAAMMRAHFGPGAETIKLISPGTRFDTGDGIRMATEQGASVSGDWNGMHIEPVDPRSQQLRAGRAGVSLRHRGRSGWAPLLRRRRRPHARDLGSLGPRHPFHADRSSIAYAILDSRLFDIDGYERAIRSEVPPYQAAVARRSCGADRSSRRQSPADGR